MSSDKSSLSFTASATPEHANASAHKGEPGLSPIKHTSNGQGPEGAGQLVSEGIGGLSRKNLLGGGEGTVETKRVGNAVGGVGQPLTFVQRGAGTPLPDPLSTLAVRGGVHPDPTTGAILTPIVQSTTYVHTAVGEHKGHTYSRASNPTVEALENALGAFEDSLPACCFGTGMGAITALFFSTLKSGDHVIVSDVVYGGTVRLLNIVLAPLGIDISYVDTSNAVHVSNAITPRTRLVFIETPANPTLKLSDVGAIAKVTKIAGVLLAVDNTFLTPAILRPLDLGADIGVYSTTKYIEGHNSTVGGSLTTRDQKLLDTFRLYRKTLGSIQSPLEAWLTLRGLKTLPLRMRQHCANAQRVAEFLHAHPKVLSVAYPGLPTFPQYDLARKLHTTPRGEELHGGIVTFEVRGGVRAGIALMNNVRLCSLAENLGAAETLITHPVSMTHGDVPRAQRERVGITDGLIRLSVGLEDPADIIADLEQAFTHVQDAVKDDAADVETKGDHADSSATPGDVICSEKVKVPA
jgi:cystathionine beta-lyase/cystathionine gamma-synthase